MTRIIGQIFLLVLTFASVRSFAYPNYISYGYASCLNCHYNPMGNGPVTDYGRALAAVLLSDRILWDRHKSDEKLSDQSGFLFKPFPVEWARPSLSYRGLYYHPDAGKGGKDRFITMDASASLVLKFLKDDKLTFVGNISYAPQPSRGGSNVKYDEYRPRELYMGYRFAKEFGLYAGLMEKAFGIRVPDHEAFSRSRTQQNQNDQTYGVMAHFASGDWEIALQPFIGNLVQETNLRQKGFTTQIGYLIDETTRIGASFLKSSSEVLGLAMYSIDARIGFDKGYSLMAEIGEVRKSPEATDDSTGRYFLLQNHFRLRPGLYVIGTLEGDQIDVTKNAQTYRFGPGIQYLFNQRFEVRADIYDTRGISSTSYSDDSWLATAQLHVWF